MLPTDVTGLGGGSRNMVIPKMKERAGKDGIVAMQDGAHEGFLVLVYISQTSQVNLGVCVN